MFGMFAIFCIFVGFKSSSSSLLCHSDDRREEESRKHSAAENVDATEILHFTTLRSE